MIETEDVVVATPVEHTETEPEERVCLNVGGTRYEVLPSTLTKYPNTLLGSLFDPKNAGRMKPDKKGNHRNALHIGFSLNITGEYFFDRNAKIFDVILSFYRTGKLVVPPELPYDLV